MGNKDQRPAKTNKPKLTIKQKKAAKKAKAAGGTNPIVVPKPAG